MRKGIGVCGGGCLLGRRGVSGVLRVSEVIEFVSWSVSMEGDEVIGAVFLRTRAPLLTGRRGMLKDRAGGFQGGGFEVEDLKWRIVCKFGLKVSICLMTGCVYAGGSGW